MSREESEIDRSLLTPDIIFFENLETLPSTVHAMYKIPRHKDIDNHVLSRYLRARQRKNRLAEAFADKDNYQASLEKSKPVTAREIIQATEIGGETSEQAFKTASRFLDSLNHEQQRTFLAAKAGADTLRAALESSNPELQITAASKIHFASRAEQKRLIEFAFLSGNFLVQERVAHYLHLIPHPLFTPDERKFYTELLFTTIEQEITNPNPKTLEKASRTIQCVLDIYGASKLRDLLSETVTRLLTNEHTNLQIPAVNSIQFVSAEDQEQLLRQALESTSLETQIVALKWVDKLQLPMAVKKKFRSLIKTQNPNVYVASELYSQSNVDDQKFSRVNFDKGGSYLTLLGDTLKNKVVVRKISQDTFNVWQTLYEKYELWEKDFGYVPIEPILSFSPNKHGFIDVMSGVLDLALDTWIKRDGAFADELEQDKNRIIQILYDNGFTHGHAHHGNFCLRFLANDKGEPDFTKKPKIHLIDFDQASVFTQTKNPGSDQLDQP